MRLEILKKKKDFLLKTFPFIKVTNVIRLKVKNCKRLIQLLQKRIVAELASSFSLPVLHFKIWSKNTMFLFAISTVHLVLWNSQPPHQSLSIAFAVFETNLSDRLHQCAAMCFKRVFKCDCTALAARLTPGCDRANAVLMPYMATRIEIKKWIFRFLR